MVKISDEVKNNKLNGGRAPNGDRLWDCKIEGCNQKNIPTGKLSEHLFAIIHGHRAIFDEENKQGQIEKVTPRGPNNVEHSTKIEHQERKCEFCGDKYTNKVLSMHRKNCNEQGNIFGCPQKDRFYAHGPNGGWAKELADALEKMEAPTDEERAEAIQITTEEGGKMGGVYVRMAKEWLETKDIATAIENWVYSGYARNAKTRQQRHMGNLNVAVQHFLVTRAEAEEARQLEATETPIVVIEGVPIKLAKAVEQALILCRVNPGKNKNTPFQQDIEWEHSKLREFAAKLLFEAFKNPKLVELEQDPEEELPAAETSEDDPAVFPTPIKTANRKKRTSSGGPSHAASFPALDPKRPNFIHPQIDASTSASAPILPSTPTSAFGQLNFIFPSTPSSTSSSKREEELAAENDALKMELNKKNEEIDRKNEEIDRKNEEIDRKNEEIDRKNEEIDRKNEEIDRKNEEIDRKNEEMERMKEENERMKEEMKRLRGDY